MEGPAHLADFSGSGLLVEIENESGERVLTGLWQADDPERAYDELHRLYMGRERIAFRGRVVSDQHAEAVERELEVIILEWSNEEHPAAIKLQEAVDIPV